MSEKKPTSTYTYLVMLGVFGVFIFYGPNLLYSTYIIIHDLITYGIVLEEGYIDLFKENLLYVALAFIVFKHLESLK